MTDGRTVAANAAVAALVGLAVGIERERSARAAGHARFAGVRTFFLLGLLGGTAGWLLLAGQPIAAGALLVGAAALVVGAYLRAAGDGPDQADATTEVAALVVLALSVAAGLGQRGLASGATAVVVLALDAKERIRTLVTRLGEPEMRGAVQFAVFALAVLPVLPDRAYGPWGGVNPHAMWSVVLLFMGLNYAGYIAQRAVGPARGWAITGLLGGIVSSTAVTLQFARHSRQEPALALPLAAGVVGACTVLIPRVTVVSGLLASGLADEVGPRLAGALAVGIAWGAWAWGRLGAAPDRADGGGHAGSAAAAALARSPLNAREALLMAVAFQVALTLLTVVRGRFGDAGVLPTAALLGLTDMDALTVAMSRLAAQAAAPPALAAHAIGVGVAANTVVKLTLVLALGRGAFRRQAATALGLVLLAVVVALGLEARRAP